MGVCIWEFFVQIVKATLWTCFFPIIAVVKVKHVSDEVKINLVVWLVEPIALSLPLYSSSWQSTCNLCLFNISASSV